MGKGPGEVTERIVNGLREITRTYEDGSFETTYEHAPGEKSQNLNGDEFATRNCKEIRPGEEHSKANTEELDIIEDTKKFTKDNFTVTAHEQAFPSSSKEYKDPKNKPIITEKVVDGRKEITYSYPDGRTQTEYEYIEFKPDDKEKMKPASKGPGRTIGEDTRYRTPDTAMSWKIVDGKKEITTKHKDGTVTIEYEDWDGVIPE